MMKKTYIAPIVMVDEAEAVSILAMSITLSDDSGSEEYVKEDDGGSWDIDW